MCVCVCVCVCVRVCVCVNARGCKEHKTTLKDLCIMRSFDRRVARRHMEPLACGLPKATICVECDTAQRLHPFLRIGDGAVSFCYVTKVSEMSCSFRRAFPPGVGNLVRHRW